MTRLNSARTDAAYHPQTGGKTGRALYRRLQRNGQGARRNGVMIACIRLYVALLAAVMTVVAAPLAHADDTDTTFINALRSHGIGPMSGNDQDLIKIGHSVCDLLAAGYSINAVIDMSKRISDEDPTYLVQTSAATYCPQRNH